MNALSEAPSRPILFLIIIVAACALSLRESRASLWDVSAGAAALSTLVYLIGYAIIVDLSPFLVLGSGDLFVLYFLCAFVVGVLCRLAGRRPLRLFQSAEGAKMREQRRQNKERDSAAHAGSGAKPWWGQLVR